MGFQNETSGNSQTKKAYNVFLLPLSQSLQKLDPIHRGVDFTDLSFLTRFEILVTIEATPVLALSVPVSPSSSRSFLRKGGDIPVPDN